MRRRCTVLFIILSLQQPGQGSYCDRTGMTGPPSLNLNAAALWLFSIGRWRELLAVRRGPAEISRVNNSRHTPLCGAISLIALFAALSNQETSARRTTCGAASVHVIANRSRSDADDFRRSRLVNETPASPLSFYRFEPALHYLTPMASPINDISSIGTLVHNQNSLSRPSNRPRRRGWG